MSGRTDIAAQCKALRNLCQVDIGIKEASADIRAFLTTRTKGAFESPLRQKTIEAVIEKAEGMFLWVILVTKALEFITETSEIQKEISVLPRGLYGAYDETLRRMQNSLSKGNALRSLCHGALQWLSCSQRPLRVSELFEAVTAGFESEHVLLQEEDLIAACGPLAMVRNDLIQLIHFSTKEYLTGGHLAQSQDDNLRQFHIDPDQTNTTLALSCVKYMQSSKFKRKFQNERRDDNDQPLNSIKCVYKTAYAPEQDVMRGSWADLARKYLPFASYTVYYWVWHLHRSGYATDERFEVNAITRFLQTHATLQWIEIYFTLNPAHSDLLRLLLLVRDSPKTSHSSRTSLLQSSWQKALQGLLVDFGDSILQSPFEARRLDPTILAQYDRKVLKWQTASTIRSERHMILNSGAVETAFMCAASSSDQRRQLCRTPGGSDELGLLIFHHRKKSLVYADKHVQPRANAYLYSQNVEQGVLANPMLVLEAASVSQQLTSSATASDLRYLCLRYEYFQHRGKMSTIVCIDLGSCGANDIQPSWATRVFTVIEPSPEVNTQLFITDDRLRTPGGIYDLKSETRLEKLQCELKSGEAVTDIIHYADGTTLCQLYDDCATATDGASHFYDYESKKLDLPMRTKIIGVSNDGEYVLFEKRNSSEEFCTIERLEVFVTSLGTTYNLATGLALASWRYKQYLFYGDNEWLLFLIAGKIFTFHLPTVLSDSSGNGALETAVPFGDTKFCVDEESNEAYVTFSREWRRIDLTSMEWKDSTWKALQRSGNSECWYSRVSSNGNQVAVFTAKEKNLATVKIFSTITGFCTETYALEHSGMQNVHIEDVVTSSDLHVFWIPRGGLYHLHKSAMGSVIKAFHLPSSFPGNSMTGDQLYISAGGKYMAVSVHHSKGKLESPPMAEIQIYELDYVHNRVDLHTVPARARQEYELTFVFHCTEPLLAVFTKTKLLDCLCRPAFSVTMGRG